MHYFVFRSLSIDFSFHCKICIVCNRSSRKNQQQRVINHGHEHSTTVQDHANNKREAGQFNDVTAVVKMKSLLIADLALFVCSLLFSS